MTPKVSIGIPAYKPEFLEEAIASVLAQTFEDWELIVVDDCSPGDIKGIVGKFTDLRIRYYRNEKNLGAEDPSYNWDRCLEFARGEYFCLLCDDDMYHPTFLEEMLKLAEHFPECNVFRARVQKIDAEKNFVGKYPSSPLWESCEDYIWHRTQGMRHQTISEWMLRTQHVRNCGGYVHSPYAWGADVESIYRFCVDGGIVSSYKVLVTFRRSGINISLHPEQNVEPKLDALALEKKRTTAFIRAHGMDESLVPLVKMKQESESRFLLKHVTLMAFLKIALFRNGRYEIRRSAILVDLIKRLLKVA